MKNRGSIFRKTTNENSVIKGIVVFNKSFRDERNRVIYQRLKSLGSKFSVTLLAESHSTYPEEIRNKVNIKTPPINFLNFSFLNNKFGKFLQRILFKIWSIRFILSKQNNKSTFIYTFALPPNHVIGILAKYLKGKFWILEVMHAPTYYLNVAKRTKKSLSKYYLTVYGLFVILVSKITIRYADLVLATSHTRDDGCSKILRKEFMVHKERLLPTQQGTLVNAAKVAINYSKHEHKYFDVMYIGSVTMTKGSVLLRSFNRLCENIPNLRLTIIGAALKVNINQFSQALESRIRYLGWLNHKEALDYLSKADLCVCTIDPEFPDNHYAQPVKLLEYLAFGKPVVATNLEGVRGIIKHGFNGLLYEPGNIDSFVDQVTTLANNPELRSKLSVNARKSVRKYDWELLNRKVIDEIRNALGNL